MGCQCANREEENKSEILKEQNEEYEQEDNNNFNSNSKEGIFNLEESNQEQNQEKSPSPNQDNEKDNEKYNAKENENEYQENEAIKISQEKSNKYANYPEKMLTLINNIRADPVSYADTIEDSIQNITEEQDHNDESKTRIIYKKKVKVALNRGEIAFKDAADELRGMGPLPPLELKNEICVPSPKMKRR